MVRQDLIEQFRVACGMEGPLELVQTAADGSPPQLHRFAEPFALLGRDRRSSICLNHRQISRRHAYFQVIAGRVFCVDLDSRTGIHWEEGSRQADWLEDDARLTIGPYTFALPSSAPRTALVPVRPDANGNPPTSPTRQRGNPLAPSEGISSVSFGWKLEWDQPEAGSWSVDRVLTLMGSSPRCKLRLRDRGASRFHCSLLCTPSGLWLVDLVSTLGTRVNSASVSWTRLSHGDTLTVGNMSFRLRKEGARALPVSFAYRGGRDDSVNTYFPSALQGTAPSTVLLNPATDLLAASAILPGQAPNLVPVRDALLVPMIAQFNVLQQQMFEQFHQAMMMMFQMFGTLQRDQEARVREELTRVQQITQELQALQAEYVSQRASSDSQPAIGNEQTPAPAAESRIPPVANGSESAPTSPPPSRTEAEEPPVSPAPTPGNIHAMLQQRMNALEQERKTRWQKLLQVMLGK
jgi:pSer/pThr/pTyr-binding forkhead associated (FHA) protein